MTPGDALERGPREVPDERGAASPVVLGLAVSLVLVSLVLVAVGHVLVERRRAASGADLAALAGAVELQHRREACPAAAVSARDNEVDLTSCRVEGERVRVTTAVTTRLLGREFEVSAQAYAGPVSGDQR